MNGKKAKKLRKLAMLLWHAEGDHTNLSPKNVYRRLKGRPQLRDVRR